MNSHAINRRFSVFKNKLLEAATASAGWAVRVVLLERGLEVSFRVGVRAEGPISMVVASTGVPLGHSERLCRGCTG